MKSKFLNMKKKKTELKIIPLLVVTKGNSDGSIFKGDIVHYDIRGNLVLHLPDKQGGGWIEKSELTPAITDFQYAKHEKYEIKIINGRENIVKKEYTMDR